MQWVFLVSVFSRILIRRLGRGDSLDRRPRYCRSTWWPHPRVLWTPSRRSPRNRRSSGNCHPDWRSECGYCQNRPRICSPDRPRPHRCAGNKKQKCDLNTLSIKMGDSICLPWKLELAIVGTLAAHRGEDLAVYVENLRIRIRKEVTGTEGAGSSNKLGMNLDGEHILIKIVHMARQAWKSPRDQRQPGAIGSPESCGYSNRKQSHDSCSIRLYNADAQVVPRHGRRNRICQRRNHRIGKPDECEYSL